MTALTQYTVKAYNATDNVALRINKTPASDCVIGGIEKFDMGDADGLASVSFFELSTDDGFPDGKASGTTRVNEGMSVPDGIDDGYVVPVAGLAVAGFDVAIGAIGDTVGATGKQFIHRNNTAQSWSELLGANPMVLILFD